MLNWQEAVILLLFKQEVLVKQVEGKCSCTYKEILQFENSNHRKYWHSFWTIFHPRTGFVWHIYDFDFNCIPD